MNFRGRIARDPHIVCGEPFFEGTPVTLRTMLASLEGATTVEILAGFPTLSEEDVRAAIVFPLGKIFHFIEAPHSALKLSSVRICPAWYCCASRIPDGMRCWCALP